MPRKPAIKQFTAVMPIEKSKKPHMNSAAIRRRKPVSMLISSLKISFIGADMSFISAKTHSAIKAIVRMVVVTDICMHPFCNTVSQSILPSIFTSAYDTII